MVWKNIHTNRQILSLKPKMQHLRIPKKRPNTQNTSMEMPNLRNTPPQRPQRSKKHLKRRTKNTKSNKCMKKYFFHRTRKSTGDRLVNLNTQVLTAQE